MQQSNALNLNILIIDDDEDDFFITSKLISEIEHYHCNVTWSASYKTALKELMTMQYNIAFVDYRLGAKTGDQLIEEAIAGGITIPIILLTGKGNAAVDKTATEKGAYDYLVKIEITAELLERSIRYALARCQGNNALKESEQKYRAMFENSKDAMFTLNESLELMNINVAGQRIFGKSSTLGASFLQLLKNETEVQRLLQLLYQADEMVDKEVVLKTLDNEEYEGILTITREKSADGSSYLQGVFHDITGLKKAEQANFIAEKFQSAQRFVKMLAHEVRNPLNNILLSVESMNEEEDETKKLYVEIVKRNSLRINDLIRQLLDSFKTYDVTLKPVPLNNIVQNALVASHDRITLKGIQLKKDIDTSLLVNADEEKLGMALTNFFTNAVEAMEEHKGTLTITSIEKNGVIHLLIADNGCGIEQENIQRLFDPYFTTKTNGVGLGLSSTMAILRSHNATVDVDSEVGKGTEFMISFGH